MLRAFGHRVATCWVLLAQICPFSNLSQQHPTCRNTVAKRTQHVAPNNVAICCVDILRSFGRGFSLSVFFSLQFCLVLVPSPFPATYCLVLFSYLTVCLVPIVFLFPLIMARPIFLVYRLPPHNSLFLLYFLLMCRRSHSPYSLARFSLPFHWGFT